jgi:hypothetical protein
MTAVEWLVDKICVENSKVWKEEIQQALEMEKQQIINAYLQDRKKTDFVGCLKNMDKAEKYYSDTY